MKKKVFISQPMGSRTQFEIETVRKELAEKYEQEGYEVIKSLFSSEERDKMAPLECLGKSLQLLSQADLVVFATGWSMARGCKIEHECAKQYGYKIEYQNALHV